MKIMYNIKKIIKSSTIDYPGEICSILFIGNCNLNCKYCYNTDLKTLKSLNYYENILPELINRKSFINHIILSGGEPLYDSNILSLIDNLYKNYFNIGIHTNGTYPMHLLSAHNKIKFVGLDIKTSPDKYKQYFKDTFSRVYKSLQIIEKYKLNFEIRTTMDENYLELDDYIEIAKLLNEFKINNWTIKKQRYFKNDKLNIKNILDVEQTLNNNCTKYVKNIKIV